MCSACCVLLLVLLFSTVVQVSDHGLAQICSSEAAVLLELLLPGFLLWCSRNKLCKQGLALHVPQRKINKNF